MKVIEKYNNSDKIILILGVMHGEEPQGEYLINRFLKENNDKIFKNNAVFVPCINEYGKNKGIRTNINGVDLNRNYPTKNWELTERNEYFGGEKPASEEETRFLMKLIDRIKPDCILTIHAPYKIVNYDGNAKEIAEKISQITGYPVQSEMGYPTPGSFGTYYGVERNIPVITLELPENEDNEKLWKDNKEVFNYLLNSF